MDRLGVYQILGPSNCNDARIPDYCREYLLDLGREAGMEIYAAEEKEFCGQGPKIFFIGSGGTAEPFSRVYRMAQGPYYLLTVPAWNSLAASMEILSYLQRNGEKGEIIHGSLKDTAARIREICAVHKAKEELRSMRIGAIGEAVTLVASRADHETLKETFGCQLIDLDVEELIREYQIGGYEDNAFVREVKEKAYDPAETEKALNVYGAVKRMISRNQLSAVTVRCFDLLGSIGTTGCIALAILNAEGIPAACEGDTRSLLAMTVLNKLTGQPVFMANPSQLDAENKEMIFAHCTLPLNMPDSYQLTTHFESGIGVALAGDLEPGPITVFKCDETNRYYAQDAELLESLHRPDLCRTQLRIGLPEGTEYFLKAPISNHQMICKGHWSKRIREFFEK